MDVDHSIADAAVIGVGLDDRQVSLLGQTSSLGGSGAERIDGVGRKNACARQGEKSYQEIHEIHPRGRGGRLPETKSHAPPWSKANTCAVRERFVLLTSVG
jgi:hypothetical protein